MNTMTGLYRCSSILVLFLLSTAAADQFRPSSGETILINQPYAMQWNLPTWATPIFQIEFNIPWMTPPFTSTTTVNSCKYNINTGPFLLTNAVSAWFSTMTSADYQVITFTEINPTSTTTDVSLIITEGYGYWI
jgi:hypothetical protein